MLASEQPRSVSCLINPFAGDGGGASSARELAVLAKECFKHVEIFQLSPGDLAWQVRKACLSDMILVGGGDGTISQVINLLGATKIPLGVLPIGTANDLARELGIMDRYRKGGLAALLRYYSVAQPTDIAIWELQHGDDYQQRHLFCNYVSFGFDAEAVAKCQDWRKHLVLFPRGLRRFITRVLYFLAAVVQLPKSNYPEVRLVDLADSERQHSVSVCNWRSIFVSNIQAVMGLGAVNSCSSPFDQSIEMQIIDSIFNYLSIIFKGRWPFPRPQMIASSNGWEILGLSDQIAVQVDGEYESGLRSKQYRIVNIGMLPVIVG